MQNVDSGCIMRNAFYIVMNKELNKQQIHHMSSKTDNTERWKYNQLTKSKNFL